MKRSDGLGSTGGVLHDEKGVGMMLDGIDDPGVLIGVEIGREVGQAEGQMALAHP